MRRGRKIDFVPVLAALPCTAHELAIATACSYDAALVRLTRAKELDLAHIGSWARSNGAPIPRFAAGPGQDVPRPKPMSSTARWRKCKRKQRSERTAAQTARQAALAHIVIPTKPQSIFAPLGL